MAGGNEEDQEIEEEGKVWEEEEGGRRGARGWVGLNKRLAKPLQKEEEDRLRPRVPPDPR